MHRVKSIGILSLAKFMAVMYGIIGLLFAPIFLMIGTFGAFAGEGAQSWMSGVGGIVAAVAFPVCYALGGFVAGLIGGLIFNLVAKWIGGIELELQPPSVGMTASV